MPVQVQVLQTHTTSTLWAENAGPVASPDNTTGNTLCIHWLVDILSYLSKGSWSRMCSPEQEDWLYLT
jgi:hypothetical protein